MLSFRSMSCFVMGVQCNPLVSKTCRYVVLSFVTSVSHAYRTYVFYQWRALVVCIRNNKGFYVLSGPGICKEGIDIWSPGFLGDLSLRLIKMNLHAV